MISLQKQLGIQSPKTLPNFPNIGHGFNLLYGAVFNQASKNPYVLRPKGNAMDLPTLLTGAFCTLPSDAKTKAPIRHVLIRDLQKVATATKQPWPLKELLDVYSMNMIIALIYLLLSRRTFTISNYCSIITIVIIIIILDICCFISHPKTGHIHAYPMND